MTTAEILAAAPTGEIRKTGHSGRVYVFGFGWMARLQLESAYGSGLLLIDEEPDEARLIANVLMAGLKTRKANNLPDGFDREQMYELLDDLKEDDVKQVWEVGKHALGFTQRLLGISPEDVKKLATQAVAAQSQPTGTPS